MKDVEQSIFDAHYLQSITENVLQEAARNGATQAEVSLSSNRGFSVSARGGGVETVEYNQGKSINLTVYFDQRLGSASLSDTRPEAVCAAVEAACHIARFTDADPFAGLADKQELAFGYPHPDLAYPWSITVQEAIELACQCEREAISYDKRIMSAEDVTIATTEGWYVYANSHGFVGYFPSTRHEISCVLIAKQGSEMQRDYSYTVATQAEQLTPVSQVAREAAQKTVRRLGAKRLQTMKVPVLFLAEEARSLIGHFVAAIQGARLYRQSSFLVDCLGQQIFPAFVQVYEQPHLPCALGSSPFDTDGVLTRPNIFIESGILSHYALSVYSARKLGLKTTGNAGGVHNLTIDSGERDLSALLKEMNRGLLVTELMGQGVNLMTGDYSRGASGYWVEEGDIQYPVQEITIAGQLPEMYQRIVEVGNDVDTRGNIRTGSILLEEMMVAGG